jgi:Domain of unknown function (DUF4832)/Beta-galactosidase
MRRPLTILIVILFLTSFGAETDRVIVRPVDHGGALVNPGMGWTLHFYSNFIENYGSKLEPSDTLEDWPGLSVIFLRVPWSFLEPKEGEYNWSLFDTPTQRWAAKGKRIAICVSSCESWLRDAVPKWVQDAGAKGIEFEDGKGVTPCGSLWEPDYLDPIFLAKLENFLAAMAKRYDGNPNVDFITVGSFGMWGEGHTVFSSKLPEDKTLECVKKHIDVYAKHFKRTQLCISDDVAGATKPGTNFPATDYALSKGITLRDDSILVSQKKPWFHADMASKFWPTMPVILEHQHYNYGKGFGKWDGNTLFDSVEAYRASYMSIHGWPREELFHLGDAVSRINRRMGYRIQPREISWPAEVKLGQPFTVETAWANAGVAPCYGGGFWSLTLKDEKGGIASTHVDESFDVRNLEVTDATNAPPVRKLKSRFTVAFGHPNPARKTTHAPPTKPGVYDVFVSVGTRDGTPQIALPIAGDDGARRYKVGRITLTARETSANTAPKP